MASGEKGKARNIIEAIRLVNQLEQSGSGANETEREMLKRFGGFGPVALSLFPHPITGQYKDGTWQALGEELRSLLSADDYDSAKRTTFNAFYTSPIVMGSMHRALGRLGVPQNAVILEPGCGIGNFMEGGEKDQRFIGVELDRTSGRIAKALHPTQDIRIENFRDTRLPENGLDAAIGNVPFADLKLEHKGKRFSLHDYFFAKSIDALKPGGVLALVTSHFTLDKVNASIREYLGDQADFVGAIRLPSDAFKREGTAVVTDIVFLRKRAANQPAHHADPSWLASLPKMVEGAEVSVNAYFHHHPEMVLGDFHHKDSLYGGEDSYSIRSNGDLAQQLREAVERLPKNEMRKANPVPKPEPAVPAFVPPPPQNHIGEGSFFVGDDRMIRQLCDGQTTAVVYGGVGLKAGGTMTGKRLAALIGLRDQARRVLQSQNEGWPEAHRVEARRLLNRAYDQFTYTYGPINKTTFGETRDGGTVRRMPNLAKFREDPDAMLVMSLEDYDETTGKANKAAILQKDVVGENPPITSVRSAEEGLLVSLDHRGAVDLAFIEELYGKPEKVIIAELGDLIYLDPESKMWETADAYLSGTVRAKLKAAETAGPAFTRNAEALKLVQPEDVLPGDIDANLGAPWIPVEDIQAFAADLFHVPTSSFRIDHLKKDATWSVDPGYDAENSVAATSDYGTKRAGGIWLFELALNMKSPVIYDTVLIDGKESRVMNKEDTLAAVEKQKAIKERFHSWIFSDPDRTERLVRLYNDTFNNLRPRIFDGSHLAFPGMNRTFTLNPHQKDAVWRGMSSGNTLLAHAVGAGKTFTMAANGMKMKEAGLIKKPMYVVPNHMLEQFAREFMQLYPNARLLVATKEDLTRDRRKLLTAKIASGEWDGIIVTHSSFERIGMSRKYQERFLREQIQEYDALLVENAGKNQSKGKRNIIKTIEKQKAAREERLKDLLAEDKKDDGLVFDELGVDQLFIDEAHFFKNLETPTKMERVAGIQTGGSERAFDLYMKARYLGERHAGHGVVFATGTPISNTMVEMYTMQRFLDPKGLSDRGIEHFDAWAATFGEVVDTMEISPDGASLRPRSRFAKFTNLPELQQMFRAFSDVQTAEMLNLPRPRLQGDKPIIVSCRMSEVQKAVQDSLVARYERIRSTKVDPREDNALAITTDGRKLALDTRLLKPNAPDDPGSKINSLVQNVVAIHRKTTPSKGTQMIFCDMGVNKTPWGYCVYDEVADKLVANGIPREQIAAIGEAESDAKKQALFEKVRNGSVRVLIGSTQKMGTGTNVQRHLVALHHLDAPWKPAEVEQREGRILRQGNTNEEVAIYRYVTEGSFDAYMWQALETKARFISQVITGDSAVRRAEDVGGQELSYAEVKAIASGNPAVLTLAEADAELQRLSILKKNYADEQFLVRRGVKDLPGHIERMKRILANMKTDSATAEKHQNDAISIGGKVCHPDRLIDMLGGQLDALPKHVDETHKFPLGTYRGLHFGVELFAHGFSPEVYLEGAGKRFASLSRDHHGPRAVLNAVERIANTFESECERERGQLRLAECQLRDYEQRIDTVFEQNGYMKDLTVLRDQLKKTLSNESPSSDSDNVDSAATLAERIKQLRSTQKLESPPVRMSARREVAGEEPVTSRIRRTCRSDSTISPVAPPMSTPLAEDAPAQADTAIIDLSQKPSEGFRKRLAPFNNSSTNQPPLF